MNWCPWVYVCLADATVCLCILHSKDKVLRHALSFQHQPRPLLAAASFLPAPRTSAITRFASICFDLPVVPIPLLSSSPFPLAVPHALLCLWHTVPLFRNGLAAASSTSLLRISMAFSHSRKRLPLHELPPHRAPLATLVAWQGGSRASSWVDSIHGEHLSRASLQSGGRRSFVALSSISRSIGNFSLASWS